MFSASSIKSSNKTCFSVKIVVCDHYSTKPTPGIDVIYSEFRGADIKQVPVLRIFGSAPNGNKVCLHIHGVFPYFYVPCPSSNPEPQFLYQLAAGLDKALNIAMKQANSSNQHIYKITLVKGLPFYGFHSKEHLYLKIFLYNPGLLKQAVDLCCNGAILGQTFQPHESHLNFTLQFFIDFNLFGMSNIDLQHVKFRNKSDTILNSTDVLDSSEDYPLKSESMCYYEADCIASHIINRQRIDKGDGIENPGLEEVWNQEKQRRQQLNMSFASTSLSQGRLRTEETDSHAKFEKMILIKLSNLIDKPVALESCISPNEIVYYPAESLEGSQLFNAVDVSMHLPDNSLTDSLNETIRTQEQNEDFNDTLVDESIALNSSISLHYSQIKLDSEDTDLLDILKVMDEQHVDDDSIMGTPAEDIHDEEISDDAEYSQIFNDETIVLDPHECKSDECSPIWNDSFWDDANIPQVDGTFDDDHVKKVRKRKMRPFKLGLSRPKSRKKTTPAVKEEPISILLDDADEMNDSVVNVDCISKLHLKKPIKTEMESTIKIKHTQDPIENSDSITDLVNKITSKFESPQKLIIDISKTYDLMKKYEPVAGPSCKTIKNENVSESNVNNDSFESSPESNDLGFVSFYNASKLFDVSFDDKTETQNYTNNQTITENFNKCETTVLSEEDIKLYYSETSQTQATNIISVQHRTKEETIDNSVILTPKIRAPTKTYIKSTLEKYNILKVKNLQPYYSNHKDVGDKVEIGLIILKLQSKVVHDQKPLEKVLNTTSIEEWRHLIFLENNEIPPECVKPEDLKTILSSNRQCVLEPVGRPPTTNDVLAWLKVLEVNVTENQNKVAESNEITNIIDDLDNTQAIGLNELNNSLSIECIDKEKLTLNDSLQVTMQADGSFLCFGSGQSVIEISDAPLVEMNYLTIMVVEIHTKVRGDLNPDPLIDAIEAVFITLTNDCPPDHFLQKSLTEIIILDELKEPSKVDRCIFDRDVTYVKSETEIIEKVIQLIRKHDPDIMCGYEIEHSSWGYILERSQVLGFEIVMEISRINEKHRQKRGRNGVNDFEGRIIGRILFNVWRLFRHELALSSYSFENCMYEVLKERVPKYSYAELHQWWTEDSRILRWIPVEHYLTRLSGTIRMLEKLDMINRTAELARLFGLQWWEVLTRGSQYRVESLMLRAARPLNLIALSPSVKQRAAMRAPECLPLIFEPESRFYSDPVIVLDFQSLYPSMMIAYNYCFSTCIGRVQNISGDSAYEFGAWRLRIPKAKLEALVRNGLVHWSPVGVGFVKTSVRRGVLPALLRRILAARQAVKKSMKQQTDENVKKALHSRQLGLKLIANVTYGYTAANFSGRMPCVEVGDSVVSKGRETLERAIKLVQNNKAWNAKVVYGDTDSMFVQVPGGTRREAFEIGQQIADAVTADNPSPVALKLEKVYQPCILQTKKRYVGFMYESPEQETPVYEAKGIETVRRDGCPAGVKLLQRSLTTLFETGDVSTIKRHVTSVLTKLADGSLPVQELFFTREYNGPGGYRPGAAAPPNEIAKRQMARDRRSCPRSGERVSWLVTAGAPGLPLVKLARTPEELRRNPNLRPHVAYYATRVLLPPLHRCLSLLGVDVFKWWTSLNYAREAHLQTNAQGSIAKYLWRERCALCGTRSQRSLCNACSGKPRRAVAALCTQLNVATSHCTYCNQICTSCCGHQSSSACQNTECPVMWRRQIAQQKLNHVQDIIRQMPTHLKCMESIDF